MAGPTAREEVLRLLMELLAAEPADGTAALLLVGAATAVDRSSATGGRRSLGETDGDVGGTDGEAGAGTSDTGNGVGGEAGDGAADDDGSEGDRPASAFNGRKSTGRKRGGQPGHRGTTMGMDAEQSRKPSTRVRLAMRTECAGYGVTCEHA